MHLAVLAAHVAVSVEHHGGIVIESRGATLEHARHDNHIVGSGGLAVELGELARNLLRVTEILDILGLAEIERVVELGKHHELCAFRSKAFDSRQIAGAVGVNVF